MAQGFTDADVPAQDGRTVLVTGANTGLGFETAYVLAKKGAQVLLGCRSEDKAEAAMQRIRDDHREAQLEFLPLDLSDLASVRTAANTVNEKPQLDLLINNAGIMMPPHSETKDGFESQFGVNHLGTFALTGLLWPKLEETPGSRIVNTSSNGHKMGKVDFDSLQAEKGYSALGQYALSKLANLLHTYELDRRLQARSASTIAVAVHPGASDTDLIRHFGKWSIAILGPLIRPFINSAAEGAWPTLMGATAPDVAGGEYFGPRGMMQLAGPAQRVESNTLSHDVELAKKMWDVSVELTGVDPQL